MTVPVDPIAIALSVAHVLDTLGIAHTIGGSLASAFAGEPRSTVDIDFVAALEESHVAPRRAIRERASANLIHHEEFWWSGRAG